LTPVRVIVEGLIPLFDRLEIPYMVGGSFASSAWGEPRQTHDIDIAVYLSSVGAERLFELTEGEFMLSLSDMKQAVRSTEEFRAFQMIHFDETFKVDVFVLHHNEYSEVSMSRIVPYELFPGLMVQFATPEDTVITKLRWFVLGNRVSDKQWNDVVQVLEGRKGQLDEAYMIKWATHFNVLDLLRDAQSQVVN
jgi:hypothetical protein